MNPYASQSHGYDSECESTLDSAKNCIINEREFSKTSCIETESDFDKHATHSSLLVLKFGVMVHLVQLLKFEKSDFQIAGKCSSDYKISV